jgi:hypothetical protein
MYPSDSNECDMDATDCRGSSVVLLAVKRLDVRQLTALEFQISLSLTAFCICADGTGRCGLTIDVLSLFFQPKTLQSNKLTQLCWIIHLTGTTARTSWRTIWCFMKPWSATEPLPWRGAGSLLDGSGSTKLAKWGRTFWRATKTTLFNRSRFLYCCLHSCEIRFLFLLHWRFTQSQIILFNL